MTNEQGPEQGESRSEGRAQPRAGARTIGEEELTLNRLFASGAKALSQLRRGLSVDGRDLREEAATLLCWWLAGTAAPQAEWAGTPAELVVKWGDTDDIPPGWVAGPADMVFHPAGEGPAEVRRRAHQLAEQVMAWSTPAGGSLRVEIDRGGGWVDVSSSITRAAFDHVVEDLVRGWKYRAFRPGQRRASRRAESLVLAVLEQAAALDIDERGVEFIKLAARILGVAGWSARTRELLTPGYAGDDQPGAMPADFRRRLQDVLAEAGYRSAPDGSGIDRFAAAASWLTGRRHRVTLGQVAEWRAQHAATAAADVEPTVVPHPEAARNSTDPARMRALVEAAITEAEKLIAAGEPEVTIAIPSFTWKVDPRTDGDAIAPVIRSRFGTIKGMRRIRHTPLTAEIIVGTDGVPDRVATIRVKAVTRRTHLAGTTGPVITIGDVPAEAVDGRAHCAAEHLPAAHAAPAAPPDDVLADPTTGALPHYDTPAPPIDVWEITDREIPAYQAAWLASDPQPVDNPGGDEVRLAPAHVVTVTGTRWQRPKSPSSAHAHQVEVVGILDETTDNARVRVHYVGDLATFDIPLGEFTDHYRPAENVDLDAVENAELDRVLEEGAAGAQDTSLTEEAPTEGPGGGNDATSIASGSGDSVPLTSGDAAAPDPLAPAPEHAAITLSVSHNGALDIRLENRVDPQYRREMLVTSSGLTGGGDDPHIRRVFAALAPLLRDEVTVEDQTDGAEFPEPGIAKVGLLFEVSDDGPVPGGPDDTDDRDGDCDGVLTPSFRIAEVASLPSSTRPYARVRLTDGAQPFDDKQAVAISGYPDAWVSLADAGLDQIVLTWPWGTDFNSPVPLDGQSVTATDPKTWPTVGNEPVVSIAAGVRRLARSFVSSDSRALLEQAADMLDLSSLAGKRLDWYGTYPGERCQRCGIPYRTVWWAVGDLWERVTGIIDGSGLRCPRCFEVEADKASVPVAWTARPLDIDAGNEATDRWADAVLRETTPPPVVGRIPGDLGIHERRGFDANEVVFDTPVAETVHKAPPEGSGVMPCCNRTPMEVPSTDRMVLEENYDQVTCGRDTDDDTDRSRFGDGPKGLSDDRPVPGLDEAPTTEEETAHRAITLARALRDAGVATVSVVTADGPTYHRLVRAGWDQTGEAAKETSEAKLLTVAFITHPTDIGPLLGRGPLITVGDASSYDRTLGITEPWIEIEDYSQLSTEELAEAAVQVAAAWARWTNGDKTVVVSETAVKDAPNGPEPGGDPAKVARRALEESLRPVVDRARLRDDEHDRDDVLTWTDNDEEEGTLSVADLISGHGPAWIKDPEIRAAAAQIVVDLALAHLTPARPVHTAAADVTAARFGPDLPPAPVTVGSAAGFIDTTDTTDWGVAPPPEEDPGPTTHVGHIDDRVDIPAADPHGDDRPDPVRDVLDPPQATRWHIALPSGDTWAVLTDDEVAFGTGYSTDLGKEYRDVHGRTGGVADQADLDRAVKLAVLSRRLRHRAAIGHDWDGVEYSLAQMRYLRSHASTMSVELADLRARLGVLPEPQWELEDALAALDPGDGLPEFTVDGHIPKGTRAASFGPRETRCTVWYGGTVIAECPDQHTAETVAAALTYAQQDIGLDAVDADDVPHPDSRRFQIQQMLSPLPAGRRFMPTLEDRVSEGGNASAITQAARFAAAADTMTQATRSADTN